MEIIYFLLPLSFFLALFFIFGFIWMARRGQYDDLDTPSLRMLLDDKYKNEIQTKPTPKEVK